MEEPGWLSPQVMNEREEGRPLKESSRETTPPYGKKTTFLLIDEQFSLPSRTRARYFGFVGCVYPDSLQSPIGIKAKFFDDHYEPPLALQAPENNRCHIVSN